MRSAIQQTMQNSQTDPLLSGFDQSSQTDPLLAMLQETQTDPSSSSSNQTSPTDSLLTALQGSHSGTSASGSGSQLSDMLMQILSKQVTPQTNINQLLSNYTATAAMGSGMFN